MARGRRPGIRTGAAIELGAAQVYNQAYVRSGRGQRGRAAGERAVRNLIPTIARDVLQRVVDHADLQRQAAARYSRAGASFTLPKEAHAERDCARTSMPGTPGKRVYIYSVETQVDVQQGGVTIFSHLSRGEIQSSQPISKGEITARAQAQAALEARLMLASSWRSKGAQSVNVQEPLITASSTCVV